jgi:hypothetical protein
MKSTASAGREVLFRAAVPFAGAEIYAAQEKGMQVRRPHPSQQPRPGILQVAGTNIRNERDRPWFLRMGH